MLTSNSSVHSISMFLSQKMSRLGTETAFEVLARAEALKAEGRDIINLGIGQPDFKTPSHIVEAAVKALHDGHHGYTPAPGIPAVRESVAEDILKYRGVSVSPENVLIVPGGKVTMFFAILMFGEGGSEILYPNPGFPIYESVINFSGAKAVPIPLLEEMNFSFSADSVLDLMNERTRLVIINSPANPTGGAVPKSEIDKLVKGLENFPNAVIMSDEIYARICYGDEGHISLLAYPEIRDRLILLDGWSKTYAMTGWRMGYSVWPDSMIEHATRLAINCHSCVNASAQFAGMAALQGPQDSVDEMVNAFSERREVIVDGLNGLPGITCQNPMGAFYVFPNITGTGLSSGELQNKMLEDTGVATVAGTSFGAYGEGYIRFSYAASLDEITESINRVGSFLS